MRNPTRLLSAKSKQDAAAQDTNATVFLIAGPGTGKSAAIAKHVVQIINSGTTPESIFGVSFTNAASHDLAIGVRNAVRDAGFDENGPSVSTIHFLALRCLRKANLLHGFVPNPIIMDDWQSKNFFDAEFANTHSISPTRALEIREFYQAFLSTGVQNPTNYASPTVPVTDQEFQNFVRFLKSRRILYSGILQGELVHEAVQNIRISGINPKELLDLKNLIVDEFQDLNPLDVEFIKLFMDEGAITFLCGDDDQSIYGFRFGSPDLVQKFMNSYPGASRHLLEDCFRSTEVIVNLSQNLIVNNSLSGRINKNISSLYSGQLPDVDGVVHTWNFSTGMLEATAVATSCQRLISSGIPADEILILLFDRGVQGPPLFNELDRVNVEYEDARAVRLIDTDEGRLCFEVLNILVRSNNFLAKRLVLGLKRGTGVGTCVAIAEKIPTLSLDIADIFQGNYPLNSFSRRAESALDSYRQLLSNFSHLNKDSLLLEISSVELDHLCLYLGSPVNLIWYELISSLPQESTLQEAAEYIGMHRSEEKKHCLEKIYTRLDIPPDIQPIISPKVKIMSLHSSKGLSSGIVFIPGLESDFVPGGHAQGNAGRVYEMARLLYVGLTRAKSTCILSFANRRYIYGSSTSRAVSPFAMDLQLPFVARSSGLTPAESAEIKVKFDLL